MSEHTLSLREYHLFNLCLQGDKEAILKFGKLVAMDERERCIKILEEHFKYDWHSQFDDAVKEMREVIE